MLILLLTKVSCLMRLIREVHLLDFMARQKNMDTLFTHLRCVCVRCELFKSGCGGPPYRKTCRQKPVSCELSVLLPFILHCDDNQTLLANLKIRVFFKCTWRLSLHIPFKPDFLFTCVSISAGLDKLVTSSPTRPLISASVNPFSPGPTWCNPSRFTKTAEITSRCIQQALKKQNSYDSSAW